MNINSLQLKLNSIRKILMDKHFHFSITYIHVDIIVIWNMF